MKQFFLITLLISCTTNEFYLKGIVFKEKEIKYFGSKYTVEFQKLNKEELELTKLSLKNSYSQRFFKDPEIAWEEIHSISYEKNDFYLFKFYPETKVFSDFLKFEFQYENKTPIKYYDYFEEVINSVSKVRYYPGSGIMNMGTPYNFIYPIDQDINTKIIYRYSFLLLIPKNEILTKFKIITRKGAIIEFEKKD